MKVVPIDIGITKNQEQGFILKNTTGGFKVINSLPFSTYSKWKEVDGVIVVDTEEEYIAEQKGNNKENRAYLASTDWYITRNIETGVAIPADILTKRQIAREAIV